MDDKQHPTDLAPVDEESSSSLQGSSPASSSSRSAGSITWAGALVAVSVAYPVSRAIPPALAAWLDGNARGGWVLLGSGLALITLATQATLSDVVTAVKRLIPRWSK